MEQKHKPNYSTYSDSTSEIKEIPTTSRSNEDATSISSTSSKYSNKRSVCENLENNENSVLNLKPKGIRGFFKVKLGFKSKNKSKQQNKSKMQNEYKNPLGEEEIPNCIKLFSKYENLYNPKNSQYGNKQIESIYYADIARSFPNHTGAQIQAHLLELRLSFEREYAIIENARRRFGEILIPSIPYYNEFLFLVPHLNIDLRKGNDSDLTSEVVLSNEPLCNSSASNRTTTDRSISKAGISESSDATSNHSVIKTLANRAGNENLKSGYKKCRDQATSTKVKSKLMEDSSEKPMSSKGVNNIQEDGTQRQISRQGALKQEDQSQSKNPESDPMTKRKLYRSCLVQTDKVTQVDKQVNTCSSDRAQPTMSFCRGLMNEENNQRLNGDFQGYQRIPSCLERKTAGSSRIIRNTGNLNRVQILCDMIYSELGCAPDFIYYDAKWRIIEILREVDKRQMIHKKGDPPFCPGQPKKSEVAPNSTITTLGHACETSKAAIFPFNSNSES